MDKVEDIGNDFKRFVRHTAQRYNVHQDTIVSVVKEMCNLTKF